MVMEALLVDDAAPFFFLLSWHVQEAAEDEH
jgi:hypothetical protein